MRGVWKRCASVALVVALVVGCAGPTARLVDAATASDRARVAAALGEKDVDPNARVHLREGLSYTPLEAAVRSEDIEILRMVLDAGGDPNRVEPGEKTVLMQAAEQREDAMVLLLLERGADAKRVDEGYGRSALHYLVEGGVHREHKKRQIVEAARALLRAGADPNLASKYEETPLGTAVQGRQRDLVQVLLAAGADPNRSHRKERPIIIAAKAKDGASVMADLIKAGADLAGACDAAYKAHGDRADDPRLVALQKAGDECAARRLGMAATREAARSKAMRGRVELPSPFPSSGGWPGANGSGGAQQPSPAPEPEPSLSGGSDEYLRRAKCSGKRPCGAFCCESTQACCVPDGSTSRERGAMCMYLTAGRGCPWGMHKE